MDVYYRLYGSILREFDQVVFLRNNMRFIVDAHAQKCLFVYFFRSLFPLSAFFLFFFLFVVAVVTCPRVCTLRSLRLQSKTMIFYAALMHSYMFLNTYLHEMMNIV